MQYDSSTRTVSFAFDDSGGEGWGGSDIGSAGLAGVSKGGAFVMGNEGEGTTDLHPVPPYPSAHLSHLPIYSSTHLPIHLPICPSTPPACDLRAPGLSQQQREICDKFVYIPQTRGGGGSASLNVACAAAIVLQAFCMWAGFPTAEMDAEAEKFVAVAGDRGIRK